MAANAVCSMLERRPADNKKWCSMRYSLWSLIVLIADVWAIVNIIQSSADTGKKVLWTVVVVLLPVVGFILWFFLGPRTGRA